MNNELFVEYATPNDTDGDQILIFFYIKKRPMNI